MIDYSESPVLHEEIDRLLREVDELRELLARMWFAYDNKTDPTEPKDCELLAIRNAVNYFARGENGDPYTVAYIIRGYFEGRKRKE